MDNGYFKKFLFFAFFLITLPCLSQEEDFLYGQLIDSTKNEMIPFASVRIKDKAMGVITNIDGTFKIPLRFRAQGDILEISCMGYLSREIRIEDLNEGEGNIIALQPGGFELNEAVVSAGMGRLSAQQIVRIAVRSIPQNYPTGKFEMVGYYRDYQVKNGNYANLNEAIINVQDEGFAQKDILGNQYQLYSYNQNLAFEIDSFARQPYDYEGRNKMVPNARMRNDGGNEFITLRMHDAIRNYGLESFSFVDSLATQFVENHEFQLLRKTNYNKETVYEIDVSYENDHYLAEGKIFINTDDFAIHKLDYALVKRRQPLVFDVADNGKERFTDGFNKMNKELVYRIQIEYARGPDANMFLNYISFYNKVLLQRPPVFRSKLVINIDDRSFRVHVNRMPDNPEKVKVGDFKIRFRNQRLPLQEYYFLEEEQTFVLCPHLTYRRMAEAYEDLFTPNERLQVPNLVYDFGNIKDHAGNSLDGRQWEYIHQYREFFTQEITHGSIQEFDNSGLMRKDLPLESELQPISREQVKESYWKNTPLPNLKNKAWHQYEPREALPKRLYSMNSAGND